MFRRMPENISHAPTYPLLRDKYKRTIVCLQRSLLVRWPTVEDESLYVINKFREPGTVICLTHILAKYSF